MKFFGFGKKKVVPPKARRKMTREEKRKEWVEQQLMARAKTDPLAESAMILKETGINIPPIDEVKQEEKKLNEKITKMAFDKIENDENLRNRATEKKIDSLLGGDPRVGSGEDGPYYPTEGERGPLDTIREYRELEKEFGSGHGGMLSFLNDPQVVMQLLRVLQSILPGVSGSSAIGLDNKGETRIMVVDVEGKLVEMSPQAYEVYKTQKEQLRLAQTKLNGLPSGQTPDVKPKGQSDSKPEKAGRPIGEENDDEAGVEPTPTEEVKPIKIDLGKALPFADYIATAMEGTPQQFVEDLAAAAEGGNQEAQVLLLFLSTATYDKLIELAKPYGQKEALHRYVVKLSDKKQWVEEVLEIIRRLGT